MRRYVPWVLLVLLVLGTAVGIGLGIAEQPGVTAAGWVSGLLATTARAGSAHFEYSHVEESPDPGLRSAVYGSGEVDFTSGSVQVAEVDRSVLLGSVAPALRAELRGIDSTNVVAIGTEEYQRVNGRWTKVGLPRNPRQQLGLQSASEASDALEPLDGPQSVVSMRYLGPGTLDGQPTTRYLVQVAPLHACRRTGPVVPLPVQGPTTMWLDGAGRLVQVRTSVRVDDILPAALRKRYPVFAPAPSGPVVVTDTLRFSDFGAPVHIAVPKASPTPGAYSSIVEVHTCST